VDSPISSFAVTPNLVSLIDIATTSVGNTNDCSYAETSRADALCALVSELAKP
jgi:hypothetical protein